MKTLVVVLCVVLGLVTPALADPFGTPVGSFNGVTAYSNGSNGYVSGQSNYLWGLYVGMKWQCVEYCRRFYLQSYGIYLPTGYNANAWYNAGMGLNKRPTGGTVAPKVGDVLCSASNGLGHVAIIRKVTPTSVVLIHQNWSNTSSDNWKVVPMTVSGGTYTVQPLGSYAWQGWLSRF